MAKPPSFQAAAALMVLSGMGIDTAQYVGRAPLLQKEVESHGYILRPWLEDNCVLPPEAWRPLAILMQAGVRPIGGMIIHFPKPEKSQLLLEPARQQVTNGWDRARTQLAQVRTQATPVARRTANEAKALAEATKPLAAKTVQGLKTFAAAAGPAALTVGEATAKATAAAAVAVGTLAMVTLGVMAMALSADPILLIALPADDGGDPVWLELARWFDEEE